MYDPDSQEQKSYIASLYDNNFKNNLNTTIADIKIEVDQLYNKCMYSNINNGKQDPTL